MRLITPGRRSIPLVLVALLAIPLVGIERPATADQGAPFPAVSESTGCGRLRTFPALATRMGGLPDAERILGPYGALFGRTIGQVESSLVWWTVPMSGGRGVYVHQRALPAFQQVTANLAEAAARGKWYPVTVAVGQTSRTVAGKYSMSYHAFGAAVDINPAQNPYRSDNRRITNMPEWYVDAWRDAGFCWGGDWLDVKDTMHFSWAGPEATPGYPSIPDPYRPITSPRPFDQSVDAGAVPFPVAGDGVTALIADVAGRGAPDVVRLLDRAEGTVVEVARSIEDYAGCTVQQSFAWGAGTSETIRLFGDSEAVGRNDLWTVSPGSPIAITINRIAADFEESTSYQSAAESLPDDVYLLGDEDGDGVDDLFIIRRTATTAVEVWTAASGFTEKSVDVGALSRDTRGEAWRFTIGDYDVDGYPDVYVIDAESPASTVYVLAHSDGYGVLTTTIDTGVPLSPGDTVNTIDYDGEGHDDLVVLSPSGEVTVYLGNTAVSSDPARWFRDPRWECPDDPARYPYDGTFKDDDTSIFEANIEWLVASGVTNGCNPPIADRFCPDAPVTRAQMASFLARALGLEPVAGNRFADVGGVHEGNINAIAAAGISLGCNPDGTLFCPNEAVTREQMASFMARALGLEPVPGAAFVDVVGTHTENVNAIAAAGVTLGCSQEGPRFCPHELVSRGQMAAFLDRGLGQ